MSRKWRVESYSAETDDRNEITFICYPVGRARPGWLVDSETTGIYKYFDTLSEAKEAVKKACREKRIGYLNFKPCVWTQYFRCKHPREGEKDVYADIEKQGKARYVIHIDSPLFHLGEGDTVYAETLASAKKACESLVAGILGFLEATGWAIEK